jgi:hypothetical protein
MVSITAIICRLMPEQPKETWQEIEEQLRGVKKVLQALKSQPDAEPVNKRLLQSVILLSGMIGTLNTKLKAK